MPKAQPPAGNRRVVQAHDLRRTVTQKQAGQLLGSVSHALNVRCPDGARHPEVTLGIHENGSVNVSSQYRPQEVLTGELPTADELRTLLEETKDMQRRLGELNEKLKAFGV